MVWRLLLLLLLLLHMVVPGLCLLGVAVVIGLGGGFLEILPLLG